MTAIGPSPFVWLQFDATAALTEGAAAVAALDAALAGAGIEDLVVLSHGWQTDAPGAQRLYSALWANVCPELSARGRAPEKVAVAGVLWPSKPYNADYDGGRALSEAAAAGTALAAATSGAEGPTDLPQANFEQVLADVAALLSPSAATRVVAAARAAAAPGAADSAVKALFDAVREEMGIDPGHADAELALDAKVLGRPISTDQAAALFSACMEPFAADTEPGTGAAKSFGDAVNGLIQGARNAAAKIANLASYYTMKERAGLVGAALGAKVLPELTPARPVRLHLVGHSFGARLVTAAADAFPGAPALTLRSLTLLQGAYSHNGMTSPQGPFKSVPDKVPGAVAMTHTHNDLACTLAYPLASRLVWDTTKRLGDKSDVFGAMGANGAQRPGTVDGTATLMPTPGKVNLFRADDYVTKTANTDAHNNVHNATCGKLVARVITT